jgi:hypothetical protein
MKVLIFLGRKIYGRFFIREKILGIIYIIAAFCGIYFPVNASIFFLIAVFSCINQINTAL